MDDLLRIITLCEKDGDDLDAWVELQIFFKRRGLEGVLSKKTSRRVTLLQNIKEREARLKGLQAIWAFCEGKVTLGRVRPRATWRAPLLHFSTQKGTLCSSRPMITADAYYLRQVRTKVRLCKTCVKSMKRRFPDSIELFETLDM